jgi:hypothetical protein
VRSWLRHCATGRKVAGSIPFCPHCGPDVDSVANRNEYQYYFIEVRSFRCLGLTTIPPPCVDYMRSWSLSLLEPSGSVRAYTGIPLPLPFYPFHILCVSFCYVYSNTEKFIALSVHTPHESTVFSVRMANITFCCKIAPQTG